MANGGRVSVSVGRTGLYPCIDVYGSNNIGVTVYFEALAASKEIEGSGAATVEILGTVRLMLEECEGINVVW
jgi:hypothetical protein